MELLNSFEKDPLLLPSFLNVENQAILDTRRPQYLDTPAMRPRLFLFDYVLGKKTTREDRDKLSSDLVDYYASQYKNILLKSETDLNLLDSATKNYPRFDYPISHPFMNIFIDKKRSVPDSYTDTDNITWGLRSANLEDDTTRMNDSLVYFNQQRTQNL